MDHTNHIRLSTIELTPAVLEGATIYGADNEKVGKVDHIHGGNVGGMHGGNRRWGLSWYRSKTRCRPA